ncbi:universal stress protein [Lysobacter sp. GX 14042]|uniref:universal stress protein n=1 Tax=Lysobacter sp. GX 14042 TaxID=2907155 RepID=UPI001F27CDA4|nr:universal stress protein [Lysobacter sp. GX 14042]MCE7031539.1 universal stress protein [Lysobacter sp. GX 14042]
MSEIETTNPHGKVLAAIDESVYTESVCRHAAWAATQLAAPLELVHVLDRGLHGPAVDLTGNLVLGTSEALLAELAELDEKRGRLAQERGRLLLEQGRSFAAQGGAEATARLRHGGLVDTLSSLEQEVRLFVLGKRGENADFAKGHLGSQMERVARAARRPLLVASREFRPVRRALVAFDGSETTRKAVGFVASSPLFKGLELQLVMVADDDRDAAQLDWARQVLAEAGRPAEAARIAGDPEAVISERVSQAGVDLLVMGAYGHSRIRQLIVGSTTTAMLRSCRIPVLLVR